MALENDYEILERLGEGAFGKVYKARHRRSEDICAVKQIKLGAKSWDEALRSTELQALKALRHPFIVRLRELIRSNLDGSLYYIFEFIGSDLFRLMRQYPNGLDEARAVEFTRQLFAGVAHIHQHNFFHRDIKPENILFDTVHETIRIADFGEARSLRARPPFTDYVGTRWYRAPECLLRDRSYSSPVDVWASGLVFAELLRGSAVFCGTSSIDQLYKIFQVLGAPPLNDWPEFARLAEACRIRVPDGRGCGLHRVVPNASKQALTCITEVLTLNPRRRLLARKILEQPLFSQGAQCPGLELDPLDSHRSGVSGVTATPTEDRPPDTYRSSVRSSVPPTASSAAAPSEEVTPLRPSTPPAPGHQRQADEPQGEESRLEAVDLDLDLDAELDKILGEPSAPASSSAPTATPPLQAVPTLPQRVGDAGTRSTSAGSFQFSPSVREASCSREAPPCDPVMHGGSQHSLARTDPVPVHGPACSDSKSGLLAPKSPSSPEGKDVDALLDSLCADLGVSGQDLAGDPEPVRDLSSRGGAGAALPADAPVQVPQLPQNSADPATATAGRSGPWGHAPRPPSLSPPRSTHEEVSIPQLPLLGSQQPLAAPASPVPLVTPAIAPTPGPVEEGSRTATAPLGRTPSLQRVEPLDTGPSARPPLPTADGHYYDYGSQPQARRHDPSSGVQPTAGAAEPGIPPLRSLSRRPSAAGFPEERPSSRRSSAEEGGPAVVAASSGKVSNTADLDCEHSDAGCVSTAEAGASGTETQQRRRSSRSVPWSTEESSRLRKAVKRVIKRGVQEKEVLWLEVSRELGGSRGPKECKAQYTRDYKAHKASAA